MEIIFCDIKKYFTDACFDMANDIDNVNLKKHFKFSTYNGDIRDLKVKNAAFISPANSFGSMGPFGNMNAGIDSIYNTFMFPNISKVTMNTISKLKTTMDLDRPFDNLKATKNMPMLPIGEAIITSLKDYSKYETCYLISAPTMELPDNIVGTDNPYRAFLACLKIVEGYKDITKIICPGLGTGVGGIIGYESARQIFEALNEYVKNI
jgi:O-acetyl-ADP-ribose deacetylase (regulator of RNase III)